MKRRILISVAAFVPLICFYTVILPEIATPRISGFVPPVMGVSIPGTQYIIERIDSGSLRLVNQITQEWADLGQENAIIQQNGKRYILGYSQTSGSCDCLIFGLWDITTDVPVMCCWNSTAN
jgi:hypothetical protein